MTELVPVTISDERVSELHATRQRATADFSSYRLPQLPDTEIDVIYERIIEAELHASPDLTIQGYRKGSANYDDEPLIRDGTGAVVLTAEHATDHVRPPYTPEPRPNADYGTAGLGLVLHEDTDDPVVLPIGLQTGDANYDQRHWLKVAAAEIIKRPQTHAHASIHGSGNSLVSDLEAPRNYQVLLGQGDSPTEQTLAAVEGIVSIGKDYDLNVGVNQRTYRFSPDGQILREGDDFSTIAFKAAGSNRTRVFTEELARSMSKPFAAIQFELSSVLRLMPVGAREKSDPKSERVGAYLGYLFMKRAIELMAVT